MKKTLNELVNKEIMYPFWNITESDINKIVKNTVSILSLSREVTRNQIASAIATAIAELMVDNEINSFTWYTESELEIFNTLDNIRVLSGIVFQTIGKHLDEFLDLGIITKVERSVVVFG